MNPHQILGGDDEVKALMEERDRMQAHHVLMQRLFGAVPSNASVPIQGENTFSSASSATNSFSPSVAPSDRSNRPVDSLHRRMHMRPAEDYDLTPATKRARRSELNQEEAEEEAVDEEEGMNGGMMADYRVNDSQYRGGNATSFEIIDAPGFRDDIPLAAAAAPIPVLGNAQFVAAAQDIQNATFQLFRAMDASLRRGAPGVYDDMEM